MAVKLEAFLALEGSLSARIVNAWGKMSKGILPLVYARLRQNDVLGATRIVDNMDLSPIMRQTRDYVRYVSYASMLFGASRLNKKIDDAAIIGSGRLTPMANRATASFASAISTSLLEAVQGKLYDAIQAHDLNMPSTNFAQSEGNVLFKAEHSTLLKPFTKFRNPINDEAQRIIQMISSLHTSRLANFGFTEEADLLNVSEYMINEQLDNKICPVCEEMHGKTFQVQDARALLERTLSTDDPTELATLQPWPSQNKASLESLRAMSNEDIVQRGWHIPPYHPWCRGQLVPVGKLPKIRDTASYQAAFPDVQPGDFSPEQVSAETFDTLGIDLTSDEVDAWSTETGAHPAEMLSLLTGRTPQEMADAAYDPVRDLTDSNNYGVNLSMSTSEEERLRVEMDVRSREFGGKASFDLVFNQNDRAMEITDIQGVSEQEMPKAMATWAAAAAAVAITTMEVDAGLDPTGEFWSDYGGVPTPDDWIDLRFKLRDAITSGLVPLSDSEKTAVLSALSGTGTEGFWELVALRIMPINEFIAEQGLSILIDLSDDETAARFNNATH